MTQFQVLALAGAVLATSTFMVASTTDTTAQFASIPETWFNAASPWNAPIGNAPKIGYSDAAITAYEGHGKPLTMNWGSAGVYVIYQIEGTINRKDLSFVDSRGVSWRIPQVPISSFVLRAARYRLAQHNTDGMTCLVDVPTRRFISFWQPRPVKGGIVVTTGGIVTFNGIGWSKVSPDLPSQGRAAGASYCGGVIRESEMRGGEIRHALALAWPKDLILGYKSKTPWRQYPAYNTDGTNSGVRGAVPMGARLQLDPTLNDAQLAGMGLKATADLKIAHALQRYGAYIVDSNPSQMGGSIYFESQFDSGKVVYGATNPWPMALIAHSRFVAPPTDIGLDDTAPTKAQTVGNEEAVQ